MKGERKMKQTEAIKHLRAFMIALQRYRSVTMEQLGPGTGELHLSEKLAAEMWPWVFGDKCPLPTLSKLLANIDSGKPLVPMDYYNMMVVLDRFIPEVKVAVNIQLGQGGHKPIPQGVSKDILKGWENEIHPG